MKVAIAHDWFSDVGGAEKVAKELHEIFPEAPIYTIFHDENFTRKFLPGAEIRPSHLQKYIHFVGKNKWLIPFMPVSVELFDLSGFDLVISSSAYFIKGLILKPDTTHICYCHSPTRQWWDWQSEYRKEVKKAPRWAVSILQHAMRIWDRSASTRVDYFIANSLNVKKRILKYYGKKSVVIYPPVEMDDGSTKFNAENEFSGSPLSYGPNHYGELRTNNYFLIVSRLFKHKNADVAVRAFNKLGWPLVIVGNGPEMMRLKKLAKNNIRLVGLASEEELRGYYQNCMAFVMPQEEDFGIAPIEAMGYGKPVLALKRGGALEYIEEGINGEFFVDPHPDVLAYGALRLKQNIYKYDKEEIKRTAKRFSKEQFKYEVLNLIKNVSQI